MVIINFFLNSYTDIILNILYIMQYLWPMNYLPLPIEQIVILLLKILSDITQQNLNTTFICCFSLRFFFVTEHRKRFKTPMVKQPHNLQINLRIVSCFDSENMTYSCFSYKILNQNDTLLTCQKCWKWHFLWPCKQ